ncbi:MAG: universal stress protein, partial [Anaerolineae bacterium]
MASSKEETGYHILAAVGAESHLQPLLKMGCALAAARNGRITILTVTTSGRPPAWLTVPERCEGIEVNTQVRAGSDPGSEILDAAHDDATDLILLGWRGDRGRGRYLLGRTLDPVVQYAACDVAIIRAGSKRGSLDDVPEGIQHVLLPTHGGPNAALAIDLALTLSPHTQVTALYVAREAQGEVGMSLARQQLAEILSPWAHEPRVEGKIVQSSSPIRGILQEANQGSYDLLMVGASHESYLDRVLFGNIPQTVAASSPVPSVVIKRHTRRIGMGTWLRRTGWRIFDFLPTLD